jgi:hypothetical protein
MPELEGMLEVSKTGEELVVLAGGVESDSTGLASAFPPATGIAANVELGVVWTGLFVAADCEEPFASIAVADCTRGTAVHRRPSIVVRNAPAGKPFEAMVKVPPGRQSP